MTEPTHSVALVRRWHTIDDTNFTLRKCAMSLKGIRFIEQALIVRQVAGDPTPHKVLAVVGEDWSTLFIEPDDWARELVEEWLEGHAVAMMPEDYLAELFAT